MSIAMTEQQRAIQTSIRRWAAGGHTLAAVRAREPGGDQDDGSDHGRRWAELAELGLFGLGLPESAGGAGAAAVDVATALEQITDALAPGPIMTTLLAGLVLSRHRDQPCVKELLPAIAAGRASVAVAFGPGLVLGAGEATHLLLAAPTATGPDWLLIPADHADVRITARVPVDFSRGLGEVTIQSGDHGQVVSGLTVEAVRDTAAWLGAVEAAAVAAWCVRTATAYAATRSQFGRPIGSFQAVKHLCAGMLSRAERATAVAWDAAIAFDQAPAQFPLAAAVAVAVALDAAVDNAKDCVQVLGGIGFTWEHDAHLYLRRAVALRQLHGGTPWWRERVADLALAGATREPPRWTGDDSTLSTMDGDADEEFRTQVRDRTRDIAALPRPEQRAALAEAGYLMPNWSPPYGLSAGPARQLIVDEELDRADLVRPDLVIAGWALPTIGQHGTPAQAERFIAASLRGELTWCQLFSEPEAGSDLAAVRTRADRVERGWRLSGQKVWTSLAHEADWAICLARTDPDVPKHRGLSYFLVAMTSPGIDIRPLREITGRTMFNEVFLDGVFVPDDCLVGAPGDGWRLARGTLAQERVAMGRGPSAGDDVRQLIEAINAAGSAGRSGVRDRLGALVADGHAVSLVDLRATLRRLAGEPADAESAVGKLIGVVQRQAVAEAALELLGPAGAAVDSLTAPAVHQFLSTRCLSIAGGTTQILLTLVGERVLGLPREQVR